MHAKPARIRKRARPSTRRKTVRWSNREVEALVAGVRTYGVGKWARILRHSPVFNGVRTSVDLKDKWRNLTSPVRAAALAGEIPPSPEVPQTPPLDQPPPPTSARSQSTSEPSTRPNIVDVADVHVSDPRPDSPKPLHVSIPEPTPAVAPDVPLNSSSSTLPTPAYPVITPYSLTQNIYQSAAAFTADYWRRSQEAMYGIGALSSIFPYVKQTPLLHTVDDDDDDDDEVVHHPTVYNPYTYALAHMLGRVDHTTFPQTFPPQPLTPTAPIQPHISEGDSLQAYSTNSDSVNNYSVDHNPHTARSDVVCAENSTTILQHNHDAHTEQAPQTHRASPADPAQCDTADGKSTACSTGNIDHSILTQEQMFMPMQSA